jgi:tripartite-type tricarboxylate transporter receptor subunit TctC
MKTNSRGGFMFAAAAVLALLAGGVAAQTTSTGAGPAWPVKTVRVIVPFAPGGGSDLTARPVAQKLSEALGQQFVIDNRGGAGGAIGMELTAKAPPDGYTVMSISGSFSATSATHKLPYDPFDAFIPVVELGYVASVLLVHPALPVKNTKELITLARAKPGTLAFASTGVGGNTHLGTELFMSMAGIKMIHVPYKSTGTAMPELMAGQTQVMVGGLLGSRPFFTTGRLRALAVTSLQRWPSFPELPAIAETVPGYDTGTYYGMFFPKGTPQAIVTRLNTEVNKVLQEGGVKSLLDGQGMVTTGGPPAALARRAKKEYDEWVKVVREAKLKIE